MLVLTRMKDESIELTDTRTGEHIATVLIVDTRSDRTRLGIQCPSWVNVRRTEIEDTRGKEPEPC